VLSEFKACSLALLNTVNYMYAYPFDFSMMVAMMAS